MRVPKVDDVCGVNRRNDFVAPLLEPLVLNGVVPASEGYAKVCPRCSVIEKGLYPSRELWFKYGCTPLRRSRGVVVCGRLSPAFDLHFEDSRWWEPFEVGRVGWRVPVARGYDCGDVFPGFGDVRYFVGEHCPEVHVDADFHATSRFTCAVGSTGMRRPK
jgi:hypothetical protein